MSRYRIIVVLGMHRSGTSVLMKAIETLGVNIGDNFLPPAADNPKGFFEDKDINAFNIELLHALNKDWHTLDFISTAEVDKLTQLGYKEKAINLLKNKLRNDTFFGFKDPRVSKLILFWNRIFDEFKCDVYFVYCLRNPFSVVKSLESRNKFTKNKGYLLWLSYNLSIIDGMENQTFIAVDYDILIKDPRLQLMRIATHLGIEPNESAIQYFSEEFIDSNLRHSISTSSELHADPECPKLAIQLYDSLLKCAESEKIDIRSNGEAFNLCTDEYERMKYYFQFIDQLEDQLAKQDASIHLLQGKLESAQNPLAIPFHNSVREVAIKLYQGISDNGNLTFLEDNSSKTNYVIGQGRCAMQLHSVFGANPTECLRLDIADCASFIQLYSIQLQHADGRVLWSWLATDKELPWRSSFDIHILGNTEENGLYLVTATDDPQTHLNISSEILEELNSGTFSITIDLSISALASHSSHAVKTLNSIRQELTLFQQYDSLVDAEKGDSVLFVSPGSNLLGSIQTETKELRDTLLNSIGNNFTKQNDQISSAIKTLEQNQEFLLRYTQAESRDHKERHEATIEQMARNNDTTDKLLQMLTAAQEKNTELNARSQDMESKILKTEALLNEYETAYETLIDSKIIRLAIALSKNNLASLKKKN